MLSKSSICSGLTTMYRGIEGSTDCASSNFLALTNLATVNPAEPCAIFWPLGNVVEVVPDLPVNAVPPKADMISSSIARPIAAAAARAYELVGSISRRTLSLSSMRSAHSYEVRLTILRECGVSTSGVSPCREVRATAAASVPLQLSLPFPFVVWPIP